MMKIQYASDLHIEFPENKAFLKANPLKPVGDILVLAGDIVPFAVLDKHIDFFIYLSDNFENTYWIAGNHEYYHSELSERCGSFHEKIKDNVHLLNNRFVKHGNVDIVFSSLWSKISPANQWHIERSMNDFHVIRFNNKPLITEHYNQLHKESIDFIEQALLPKSNKTLVVSHHVPTFMNYPPKFKGDALNEAFAVELFDLIERHQPECWIYGHTHGNTPGFNIGNTKLLTNQLGYVKYGEHLLFEGDKVFKI